MTKKKVEFNMDDNKKLDSNDNMEISVDTSSTKATKYQTFSINYWGEGPSEDKLSLSYDY